MSGLLCIIAWDCLQTPKGGPGSSMLGQALSPGIRNLQSELKAAVWATPAVRAIPLGDGRWPQLPSLDAPLVLTFRTTVRLM